jgi:hypothetical protein
MKLEWTYIANTYFDQLSGPEQSNVMHAVARLPEDWDNLQGNRLNPLTGDLSGHYALKVGDDLRVIVKPEGNVISIVDVVRTAQINGLRRVAGTARRAS